MPLRNEPIDGIVMLDDEWRIVASGNGVAELLAVEPRALVGEPIGAWFHPDDVVCSPREVAHNHAGRIVRFVARDGAARARRVRLSSGVEGAGWQMTVSQPDVVPA